MRLTIRGHREWLLLLLRVLSLLRPLLLHGRRTALVQLLLILLVLHGHQKLLIELLDLPNIFGNFAILHRYNVPQINLLLNQ
jgi:hypothetical protein